MRVRSRLEVLERRMSPTGECVCNGGDWGELMYCRHPHEPPPPRTICTRCGRRLSRLILGPVPWAKCEKPYHPLTGLMDFYERTVRPVPAYEPATIDTVLEMMAPTEPGAAP